MLPGLRNLVIDDPIRFSQFPVMYPIPGKDDPWGVLKPLKQTSWAAQIPVVTGEAVSHALHGEPKFLREQLGKPPTIRAKKLPVLQTLCLLAQQNQCVMAKPTCHPGTGELPDCYQAPWEEPITQNLMSVVAKAWDEGRYVFVVEGPEFTLHGV